MTESIDFRRCGYCGRRFTKSNWRRNIWACETCMMYVCHDCTTNARVCPTCGSKVDTKADFRFILGIALGSVFLPAGVYTMASMPSDDPGYTCMFGWMIILPLIFLAGAGYYYNSLANLKKAHIRHISHMPKGIIPIEKRPNFFDLSIKERREVERSRRSPGHKKVVKEIFQHVGLSDLVGDWDFPVLSKEERIVYSKRYRKGFKQRSQVLTVIGLIIIFSGIALSFNFVLLIIGIPFLLMGILFLSVIRYAEGLMEKDTTFEAVVSWKTIGYKKTISSLDGFMKQSGEKYDKKVKEISKGSELTHPEVEYHFDNGNHVATMYNHIYGGLTLNYLKIRYTQHHYNHAKKLQRELDRYLGERDLIERK